MVFMVFTPQLINDAMSSWRVHTVGWGQIATCSILKYLMEWLTFGVAYDTIKSLHFIVVWSEQ